MQYGKIPIVVLKSRALTAADKVIYGALALCRNHKTGKCNPTYDAIAELVRASRMTVYRAIVRLEKEGFVGRVVTTGLQADYILPHLENESPTGNTDDTPTGNTDDTPTGNTGDTPRVTKTSTTGNILEHPLIRTEQTKEQTKEQTPRAPACTWAREFVESWNQEFPKTLNKTTNQLADQAAAHRAVEMEHKSLGDLQRIRDWLKESGRIAAYQRPARWFKSTGSGVRVLDQIDMEMEADQARQAKRNGHPRASPPPQSREELRAFFERDEKERAEKKRQREEEKKADAQSAR